MLANAGAQDEYMTQSVLFTSHSDRLLTLMSSYFLHLHNGGNNTADATSQTD